MIYYVIPVIDGIVVQPANPVHNPGPNYMNSRAFKILGYVSLVLNAYYFIAWIVSFNKFHAHSERIDFFKRMVLGIPIAGINLVLLSLGFLSIFYWLMNIKESMFLYILLSIIQLVFSAFLIFGLM